MKKLMMAAGLLCAVAITSCSTYTCPTYTKNTTEVEKQLTPSVIEEDGTRISR